MFFRTGLTAFLSLDNECCELVAIYFRKHDINVSKATVGNEHFLAIENVFLAIVTELGRRLCGHRI